MTDEELIARLRMGEDLHVLAADRIEALVKESAELTEVFDMQWRCDMRAIEMWREAHPGNELVQPDGAKLSVWLMDVVEKQGALLADAYGADMDWDEVLKQRADHEAVKKIEALEGERDRQYDENVNCIYQQALAEARAERLEAQVEQYRNTNRRMNRRVQMLEGWWQRRLERANYWRGLYLWGMRRKDLNVKAIEEAAYQRGYEDGFEEKFRMPKLWARPRRINSGDSK